MRLSVLIVFEAPTTRNGNPTLYNEQKKNRGLLIEREGKLKAEIFVGSE